MKINLMIKVKVLKDFKGCLDGITPQSFKQGDVCDIPAASAASFTKSGLVELVKELPEPEQKVVEAEVKEQPKKDKKQPKKETK